MADFTAHKFKKQERLKSKKLIDLTFESGYRFSVYPLRVIVKKVDTIPGQYPAQIMVSVPKRNIRKAAARNLLRRRIKEAYRKNKHLLYQYLHQHETTITLVLVYTPGIVADYTTVENAVIKMIRSIIDNYEKICNSHIDSSR